MKSLHGRGLAKGAMATMGEGEGVNERHESASAQDRHTEQEIGKGGKNRGVPMGEKGGLSMTPVGGRRFRINDSYG